MADVNVTDLTQETYSTMDGTEQVIMFDSAEGKRATVAAVGEYVLKKLTTSLNGSTQTVANALASLNSDTWSYNVGEAIPANSNLNDYNTVGNYLCVNSTTAATLTNPPVTGQGFIMKNFYSTSTNALFQLAITNSSTPNVYIRRGVYSSSSWSWGSWVKLNA